jgi:hypothetical protein
MDERRAISASCRESTEQSGSADCVWLVSLNSTGVKAEGGRLAGCGETVAVEVGGQPGTAATLAAALAG